MKINLQNLHPSKRANIAGVRRAIDKWGRFRIKIFLTDDAEISRLHYRFLGIKGPTDVMAFSGESRGEGEVIISLDTAIRQARERRIPLRWELTLLSVHGILHLNGYRDQKFNDWKKMRVKEFETIVKII